MVFGSDAADGGTGDTNNRVRRNGSATRGEFDSSPRLPIFGSRAPPLCSFSKRKRRHSLGGMHAEGTFTLHMIDFRDVDWGADPPLRGKTRTPFFFFCPALVVGRSSTLDAGGGR